MKERCSKHKSENDWERERTQMVEEQLCKRGISDGRVLLAMRKVPRHLFVPPASLSRAYSDGPLPIGEGQTVSQPYMVALMSQSLALQGIEKVLEIGTGSGYQSAVLLELAGELYTVERIGALAAGAEVRLRALGYSRFHIRVADGTLGWPEAAPYDAIIVAAGAPHIPQALKQQLKEGGRLVIPLGNRFSQQLCICTRQAGSYQQEESALCVFVPLIGDDGWKDD